MAPTLVSASRRELLAGLAIAGGAATLCRPARALLTANPPTARENDWAWLVGNWDVEHHRLKERLAGSAKWEDFRGRSALWLTMGGRGTVDDNLIELPDGTYRAAEIRGYDPVTDRWAIWWLDGRNPTRLDPPVMGGFDGNSGRFAGEDMLRGRPITMRFRWTDTDGPPPRWEQAFSPDKGASWEVNWRMRFTRTAATPAPLAPPATSANAPGDFNFLVGRWAVRHRRLAQRLAGSTDWAEFGGTLVNWPLMGGQGNAGDNFMEFPTGTVRGVGVRAFDPASGRWVSWWLDGRNAGMIAPPVMGGFADGTGTFVGDDMHDGRPVKARVIWLRITPRSARWEQAFSADGGATWETSWISDFVREA